MSKFLTVLISPSVIIVGAVLLRLIPHLPNFAPIAAMALFGGTYLNKKYALVIPLLAMFVSDLFLGFHSTMPYVYSSFFLTGLIGLWLRSHKNWKNVLAASLGSSVLFFLVTNFGVWASGWYPQTLTGLTQSYLAAIPFFRNTLAGDLFYTGVFFGGYELAKAFLQKPSVTKTA
jgi:hypothetical protein